MIRTQFVCGFSLSSSSLLGLSLLFFSPPPQPSHMKTCPLHTHTHDSFSATRGLRALDETPGRRHLQYATCIKVCTRCTIGPKMTAFYTSTHHYAFFVNTHFSCRFACSAVVHIEHEQAETFAVQVEFGLKLRRFLF